MSHSELTKNFAPPTPSLQTRTVSPNYESDTTPQPTGREGARETTSLAHDTRSTTSNDVRDAAPQLRVREAAYAGRTRSTSYRHDRDVSQPQKSLEELPQERSAQPQQARDDAHQERSAQPLQAREDTPKKRSVQRQYAHDVVPQERSAQLPARDDTPQEQSVSRQHAHDELQQGRSVQRWHDREDLLQEQTTTLPGVPVTAYKVQGPSDGRAPTKPRQMFRPAIPRNARSESPFDYKVPRVEQSLPHQRLTPTNRALLGLHDISTITRNRYERTLATGRAPSVQPSASLTPRAGNDRVRTYPAPLFLSDTESNAGEAMSYGTPGIENLDPAANESAPRPDPNRSGLGNRLDVQTERLTVIRQVTDNLLSQRNQENDVLGALQLTLDRQSQRTTFPVKTIQVLHTVAATGTTTTRYQFHEEYAEHLVCTMGLTNDAVNAYLQAAGSPRAFSFGNSARYGGRSFENLVYSDWATRQIVLSLEKRLLRRLERAYRSISLFMSCTAFEPDKGFPRVVSPAFTSDSEFARGVANTIASARSTPSRAPPQSPE